ncbi:MAG: hypothetical protein AAF726_22645 [Planctomycetota bacterium]
MDPDRATNVPSGDLQARLDRLERRLDELHGKVDNSQKGGGGVGCLGIIFFVVLFAKADEILDAVQALAAR